MKFLNSYNLYLRVSIINLICTLSLSVIAIPFFFFKLMEIPLGILLGGFIASLLYAILSLLERRKIFSTVIFIIVKTLLIAAIILGFGFLYYPMNFHAFNPFAVALTYLMSTVVLLVLSRKEANND